MIDLSSISDWQEYQRRRQKAEARLEAFLENWRTEIMAERDKFVETFILTHSIDRFESNVPKIAVRTAVVFDLAEQLALCANAEITAFVRFNKLWQPIMVLDLLEEHVPPLLEEVKRRRWNPAVKFISLFFEKNDFAEAWDYVTSTVENFVWYSLQGTIWSLPLGEDEKLGSAMDTITEEVQVGAERRTRIENFLRQFPDSSIDRIHKLHIWKAVGHTTGRQFQFWQAGSEKATKQDDINFSRILAMNQEEFHALLRKKQLL